MGKSFSCRNAVVVFVWPIARTCWTINCYIEAAIRHELLLSQLKVVLFMPAVLSALWPHSTVNYSFHNGIKFGALHIRLIFGLNSVTICTNVKTGSRRVWTEEFKLMLHGCLTSAVHRNYFWNYSLTGSETAASGPVRVVSCSACVSGEKPTFGTIASTFEKRLKGPISSGWMHPILYYSNK